MSTFIKYRTGNGRHQSTGFVLNASGIVYTLSGRNVNPVSRLNKCLHTDWQTEYWVNTWVQWSRRCGGFDA